MMRALILVVAPFVADHELAVAPIEATANAPIVAPVVAPIVAPIVAMSEPSMDIRAAPIVDMYFHVRSLAQSPKADATDVGYLFAAVDAASALQKDLGGPLGWGPIEGLMGECATGKELRAAFARASETIELRSGKTVELRKPALHLAEALEQAEPVFLEKTWPAHEADIRRASDAIATGFRAKQGECLAYVAKHLALSLPDQPIRVRLVENLPPPGAVTQRDDDGRGISFVSVHGANGTQLFETILHESTHTLDLSTKSGSVLDDLRARLEKAGYKRTDREWRDVPHTLMFIQAGETIRRIVDPKHEYYGDVAGYYAKVKMVAEIERPLWAAYLDGKMPRDEAIEKIVRAVVAASPPH